MNNKYNVISLFSGAMGLDLGVEKAGFDIKVCVEYDKWAAETIRKNSNVPVIEDDINNISGEQLLQVANLNSDEVFMIVGGPPCQPFSSAGNQQSLGDFRANTIIRYLNLVEEIQPQYFIMENVRGLLSSKLKAVPEEFSEYEVIKDLNGSVMYFLKNEFKKYGYTISFALFNAANYGVPQKRERIIIFGNKGNERIPLPVPTHSENAELPNTKPWKTIREAFEGLPPVKEEDYSPLRKNSIKYLEMLEEGQNWRNLPDEIAKEAMGNSYFLGGGKTGFYRRLHFDEPSPTLVTSPTMPATLLCHPKELRPLSVKEYARIQQFPDEWEFCGNIAQVYKQIGNAVPVGLGYMAAKNIMDFHSERNNLIKYSRYKNTTDYEFQSIYNILKKKSKGE
ncbi:TPA: DNA cytosine methyltransferase [Clostridium botulinum]|nr:DNA cytosine methyltransferase [Clostridium botulinum]